MVGGVLVEKDAETIRKELDTHIMNIKLTLEAVQKTLKTQEGVMKDWEKKYSDILTPQKQQTTQTATTSSKGGVLA
jgi:hypothetical protein